MSSRSTLLTWEMSTVEVQRVSHEPGLPGQIKIVPNTKQELKIEIFKNKDTKSRHRSCSETIWLEDG